MGTLDGGFIRGILAGLTGGRVEKADKAEPTGRESRANLPKLRRNFQSVVSVLSALSALSILSCATNPATGERQIILVSENQEIEMGLQGARETVQAIPPVADSGVQRFTRAIGLRMAQASERPQLPWSFVVLDDASVNAFAYPGGPIFVTRGILTHMTSEAELAAVLGHEIGHITARHTASQISKAQLLSAGLIVGSIVSPVVRDLSGVANVGLGLLFLKYGRDAENQADELGFRYMTKDRYDPRAMSSVFQMLARTSALAGQGRLPEWQSTHPYPEDRVENNEKRVAQMTPAPTNLKVNRTAYLQEIDGMVFGEDPRQGFFEGNRFNHPDLRFRFDFPAGWKTQNQPAAVVGQSQNQDALMSLSFAQASSPGDAMRQFVGQQGIRTGGTSNAAINGFPASWAEFEATTTDGVFVGQIAYLQDGSRIYQILAYTTSAGYRTYSGVFQQSIRSYNRLTDQAALSKQPVRLHLVQISRDMTIEQFNQSYPSTIKIDYLAAINAVQPGERIPSGSWVKQVR